MNTKIFFELQNMLKISPHLLRDENAFKKAIESTFNVEVADVRFDNISELVDRIDTLILSNYFLNVWQPKTKQYKYSGLTIIDEINSLNPERVLDLGCGYNEFKNKINNLTGVDPYNPRADIQSSVIDYKPEEQFNIVISLGSINFGTVEKIFTELEHAVNLTKTGGLLYFRVNPGKQHEAEAAKWIDFFDWHPYFILNAAKELNCDVIQLKPDQNRFYFVLKKTK